MKGIQDVEVQMFAGQQPQQQQGIQCCLCKRPMHQSKESAYQP